MLPSSAREVRQLLKTKGIAKPPGAAYADLPVIKLPQDFWDPHFEMVARKLLLSLHYQCFGTVLPPSGRVWSFIHTNADFLAGEFPLEIMNLAKNIARPVRQKKLLDDQFLIRWNVVPETKTALFAALLHGTLSISGVTTETPHRFSKAWKQKPSAPFVCSYRS